MGGDTQELQQQAGIQQRTQRADREGVGMSMRTFWTHASAAQRYIATSSELVVNPSIHEKGGNAVPREGKGEDTSASDPACAAFPVG